MTNNIMKIKKEIHNIEIIEVMSAIFITVWCSTFAILCIGDALCEFLILTDMFIGNCVVLNLCKNETTKLWRKISNIRENGYDEG